MAESWGGTCGDFIDSVLESFVCCFGGGCLVRRGVHPFVFRTCGLRIWVCAFRRDGFCGELEIDIVMVESGPLL